MRAALNFVPPAPGRPARYGFMFQMGLETNHCIPKQHLKEMLAVKKFGDRFDNLSPADKLWVNNKMEAVQDTMPAFPLKVNQHRVGMGEIRGGVRRPTFHELSDKEWAGIRGSGPEQLDQMKTAVREAYRQMNLEYGSEEGFGFEQVATQALQWFDNVQID